MTISCTDGSLVRVGGRSSIGTATAAAGRLCDLGGGMDRRAAGIRGLDGTHTPDPDQSRPRRRRRARVRRAVAGPRPGLRAWLTTGDRIEPARRAATRGAGRAGPRRADDRGRSGPLLPAHGGLRRLDHRLLGPPAGPLARSRRHHALALRPAPAASASATCASRWAPRTSSWARTTPTTTSRPGQTDFRLKHFSIAHDRAEILPLLRQALRAEPESQGHGDAVEPAGVDEDQRLARRRSLQGRSAGLRRLRALLRALHPGLPPRAASRSTP